MTDWDYFGLFPDGPGKKTQAVKVTDPNDVDVYRQVGVTSPYPGKTTQTIVTLQPNASAQLVAANDARVALRWMVTGGNPMTVSPGNASAVVGVGMNYNGASLFGSQGGGETFEGVGIVTDAFQAISENGTTVCVWETT